MRKNYLEQAADFFDAFQDRLRKVQFNYASAFGLQGLEIAQRLRIAELTEGVVLARDFDIVGRVGGQD